ncbi:hypothetical protein GIB67_021376, partial [Kingdonia uniflora]
MLGITDSVIEEWATMLTLRDGVIDGAISISTVQVWAVSDFKRQGFLCFKEFISAMQVCFPLTNGK